MTTTTQINAKTIKTKDLHGLYDALYHEIEMTSKSVSAGADPHEMAKNGVIQVMNQIGHALRANGERIINTYRVSLDKGNAAPTAWDQMTPQSQELTCMALGGEPKYKLTSSSPTTKPDTSFMTVDTKKAAEFKIDPNMIPGIDSLIGSMTGERIGIMDIMTAMGSVKKMHTDMSDHITTLKGLVDEGKSTQSVSLPPNLTKNDILSKLPKNSALAAALDSMLKSAMESPFEWQKMVESLNDMESDIANMVEEDLQLRRAAKAKANAARTVAATSAPAATPTSGSVDMPARVMVAALPEVELIRINQVRAKTLFPQSYGAAVDLLDFDVPRMEFDDEHPDVPVVDPTYQFYVPVLAEAMQCIADRDIMWLYGDSGCGKSEFWKQIAARLNMPFTRVNMDGHLTRSDLIGVNRMVPNDQRQMEMRFIDGILPRAMARPGLFLIDEMDLGDPEIMAVLQPVLEGEPLRILEDHGRIVHPHPEFRIAITGNTTGLGSANNAYVNVHEQSAATRDRVAVYVQMPYMTPDVEKKVIMARVPGLDTNFLDKLIRLANLCRTGYSQGDINQIFSTRSTIAAARKYARMHSLYPSEEMAVHDILKNVILNRMDDTSHNTVKGYIDNLFT